jgi:hypothetical protein
MILERLKLKRYFSIIEKLNKKLKKKELNKIEKFIIK